MVKAVQAEDSVAEHFDGLLKNRVPAEVGLLIGKPSVGSRDIVLAAVPTPGPEGGEEVLTITSDGSAAATKAKRGATAKGKSNEPAVSISLDTDSIAEHALQVSRLLPGGLEVLGLYLFAPDSGYSSASNDLCKALGMMVADAAAAASGLTSGSKSTTPAAAAAQEQPELLLLHVDSSSRKYSMRTCLASSGAAVAATFLKPCELKFGPSLASLVCLRIRHTFDCILPATASSTQLRQLLQSAAAAEAARVMTGLAVLSGNIPSSSSQPLADLLPASSSGTSSSQPAAVELYCSPPGAAAAAAAAGGNSCSAASSSSSCSSSAYMGSCKLHGSIEALAFAHRRDSAAKALSELKQDVVRSLAARLQLLVDDVLSATEEAGGDEAAAAAAHPLAATAGAARKTLYALPRRVLVPWSGLGVQACDYLMEGEGSEMAAERVKHLLQLEQLQPQQVQEVEGPAQEQQRQAAAVKGSAVSAAAGSGAACSSTVMAAAAAGIVAALSVALAYVSLGQ